MELKSIISNHIEFLFVLLVHNTNNSYNILLGLKNS